MDSLLFVAAALSLLATPGPTNTLLATAGAAAGLRRSIHLLAAEISGYLLAIALLRTLVGPLITATPQLGVALRLTAALYLIYLAISLWRHGSRQLRDSAPVTFGRVFVTTLLNPKAIIFAFTLLPSQIGLMALLPWLACLSVLIVSVGASWICVGALLGRGLNGRVSSKIGYRFSAVALTLLAGLLGIHTIGLV